MLSNDQLRRAMMEGDRLARRDNRRDLWKILSVVAVFVVLLIILVLTQ